MTVMPPHNRCDMLAQLPAAPVRPAGERRPALDGRVGRSGAGRLPSNAGAGRPRGHGQVANAAASWIGWNGVRSGLR